MSKDLDLSIDWQEHQRRSKAFAEFIKTDKVGDYWKCRICNELFNKAHFSRHLKGVHNLSKNQYYQKYVDPKALNCVIVGCTSELPEVDRLSHGFPSTCSDKIHRRYLGSCCQSMTMERLNREWWQNEEYRKTASERNAKIGFTSEEVSEWNKKNWEDEEYRRKMTLVVSKSLRRVKMENRGANLEHSTLYCLDLGKFIKIGCGQQGRLNDLSQYPILFTYFDKRETILLLEDKLLTDTEDFLPTNLEEVAYDSSLGGSFELRTKDALPKIFEILDNYGVKGDETK